MPLSEQVPLAQALSVQVPLEAEQVPLAQALSVRVLSVAVALPSGLSPALVLQSERALVQAF